MILMDVTSPYKPIYHFQKYSVSKVEEILRLPPFLSQSLSPKIHTALPRYVNVSVNGLHYYKCFIPLKYERDQINYFRKSCCISQYYKKQNSDLTKNVSTMSKIKFAVSGLRVLKVIVEEILRSF